MNNSMDTFFDEYSPKWLEWFKRYIMVATLLLAVGAFIGAIVMTNIAWITDSQFLDFLIWLIVFACADFLFLLTNMLLLGFLRNVQAIRETVTQGASGVPGADELPDL